MMWVIALAGDASGVKDVRFIVGFGVVVAAAT